MLEPGVHHMLTRMTSAFVLAVLALVVVGTLVAIGIGLFIYSLAPRTTAVEPSRPARSGEAASARDDGESS